MNVSKIRELRRAISQYNLDALLISREVNVAYLSDFRGEGQLLISPHKGILIVDPRFEEQAAQEAQSWQIYPRQNFLPLEKVILNLARKLKLNRLGFEGLGLSYDSYRRLKRLIKPVQLVPTTNIVEYIRAIKTVQEISCLRRAAALAVESYAWARKITKPGIKEVEIARKLQYFMRKHGAEDSAFEIIVASGKRSSLPHAAASQKIIRAKEAVLFDLGCRLAGYNSDLTRMVFLDKIRGKLKRIYEIVLRAQEQAIEAVRAGIKICEIDKIARQHIAKEGLGAFFGHALGHGIGREVHEYPSISPNNQDVLKEGMVFTIEPAVYIPGWGGIRMEDMVLVTAKGCEILTKTRADA